MSEMNVWLDALLPYIIQYDIWSNYHFADLLGQGSYGKVFLATRIIDESQSLIQNQDLSIESAEGAPK